MAYACKTSSARSIVGVIPYLPYSKQCKMRKRGCIVSKLLAKMMCKSGLSHIITMDLHQKEIQGFFDCPVDNLRASPFLLQYIQESVSTFGAYWHNVRFISIYLCRFQIIEIRSLLREIRVRPKRQRHMLNVFDSVLLSSMANKRNRKVMKSMVDIRHQHFRAVRVQWTYRLVFQFIRPKRSRQ